MKDIENETNNHQQSKIEPHEYTLQSNSTWTSSSSVPWKETDTEDEWVRFDEAVKIDPRLKEKLQRKDNFKTLIDEYEYLVKLNSNGFFVILRNKKYSSHINSYNKLTRSKENQTISKPQKDMNAYRSKAIDTKTSLHTNLSTNEGLFFDQVSCCIHNIMKYTDIKLIELVQFQMEEGWEIHPFMPVCVLRDKPYALLIRVKSNTG